MDILKIKQNGEWVDIPAIVGPKGDKGETGPKGDTGATGPAGATGATPAFSIGTVTTGAAGSSASATITGTPENPALNLTIPRGDPGEVTQEEFDELKSAIDNLDNKLDDAKTDFQKIAYTYSNLFDKTSTTLDSNSIYWSNYIEIKNGESYAWYSTYQRQLYVYDENKENETTLYNATSDNGVHTITLSVSNKKYARFKIMSSEFDTSMFVHLSFYPTIYCAYGSEVICLNSNVVITGGQQYKNPLYSKKLAVNGDSIMYGAGYTGGFAKMIADDNNMTLVNDAVSGGCLTSGNTTGGGSPAHCISTSVSSMPDDADYILFDGGINDMWHDILLGTYSDDMSVVGVTTTIYGALDTLFQTALNKWKTGQKIGFVITHKIGSTWRTKRQATNLSFADYRDAIIKMCNKYSIPYCDIYMISQFNTELPYYYNNYTTNDGTHPNENGYKFFYKSQVENFLKSL